MGADKAGDGATYLFDGQSGELLRSFPDPANPSHPQLTGSARFGGSVAGVGDNVLVGAAQHDVDGRDNAGAAFMFDGATGDLLWSLFGNARVDELGLRVSAMGSNALVGTHSGQVAYLLDGETGDTLRLFENPDPSGGNFGHAVAVAGERVVVGSYSAIVENTAAGAVFLLPTSDEGEVPGAHVVALDPGQIVEHVNFGNYRPTVVGRYVFYNDSAFDGESPGANAADDGAVAPDKTALLPGGTGRFANYTSYDRGINGVMIDVAGLPDDASPTATDFKFRIGNNNVPETWAAIDVMPSVSVRRGAGVYDSDRLTIIWPDRAVSKQWLEVTVLANDNTGLPADDVFYFGNAVAEAGNSDANARVTVTDLLLARNNPRTFLEPAEIDSPYDYNRDQRVNTTDLLLARNNPSNFLTALRLIDLSGIEGESIARLAGETPQPSWSDLISNGMPEANEWRWLSEYHQLSNGTAPAAKADSTAQAVDSLLMTYWD